MDLMGDEISRLESLDAVAAMVKGCRKCPLCSARTNTVPGEGNPSAQLMCIGEGPGATEDATGRPFVGQAGELLNGILASIGLSREQVFIANIVKCRPPQNRKPLPDEAAACMPYLRRQIALSTPQGDPGAWRDRRRGAAQHQARPRRFAQSGASLRRYPSHCHVSPSRSAAQSELEEADVG